MPGVPMEGTVAFVLFDRTGDGFLPSLPSARKLLSFLVLLFRNVCGTPVPDVMNQEFFSVLVQVAAALGLAGMILLLSILMGKRSSVRKPADIPYECGMIPMGEGAPMFSVKFYMVAMLFVIFDLEVVFLYPWAVNFRDYIMMNPESFTAMCIFIGILLVAYLYALGKGALNWHHDPR